MSLEGWVELAALGLAVWAARLSLPRAPRFDAERLFKVALANALRGELEARGGDLAAWREAVLGRVMYHPAAGAAPEALALDPASVSLPVPPPEGARALVEKLGALPDAAARLGWMYAEDPAVETALLGHPDELGPDYDPGPRLAPGVGWDALAAWTPEVTAALARRFESAVLVELGGGLAEALVEAAPGVRLARVDPTRLDAAALAAALVAVVPRPVDRLILVGEGDAVPRAIGALAASAPLRDALMGLVSVAGALGAAGSPARVSLESSFRHEILDPEVHRSLPYLTLIDGAAPPEVWPAQRLPEPPPPPTGRLTIDRLDLGPCDLAGLSRPALARALWVVLAWRLG